MSVNSTKPFAFILSLVIPFIVCDSDIDDVYSEYSYNDPDYSYDDDYVPGSLPQDINNTWVIICKSNGSLEESYEFESEYFRRTKNNDTQVIIVRCPPPKLSYAEFLEQVGLGTASIEWLVLQSVKFLPQMPLLGKYFMGLSISKLSLNFNTRDHIILPPDLFSHLPKLTKFVAKRVEMPPIPASARIVEAELGRGVSLDLFGACDELRSLFLSEWEVRMDHFLASCSQLTSLTLHEMLPLSVYRVVQDTKYLTHLKISNCRLYSLPDNFFDHLPNLTTLHLNNNFLSKLELRSSLPLLEVLDLNTNRFSAGYPEIVELFKKLPQLRILDVSYTSTFNFCINKSKGNNSSRIGHTHLESLILIHTRTNLTCIEAGAFPSLRYLNLQSNDILVVQFHTFQISNVYLRVNLWDNFLSEVNFTEATYNKTLAQKYSSTKNVTISLNGFMELDCDCHHGWFATALRENLVQAPRAHCKYDYDNETHVSSTHHISLLPPSQLECDKFSCDGCDCRKYWKNNSVVADCRGKDVTKIPNVAGLTRLLASSNRIVLHPDDLPDTLIFLDLTKNYISHVDKKVATTLFSVKDRRILLSENPILCDCDNIAFIEELQKSSEQVEDYENIACAGNGTLLHDIISSDLCRVNGTNYVAALIASGVVLIVAILSAVLQWRYGRMIHMFLYARGWLCCVNEEKLDADRIYDAFVSYCHVDGTIADEIVTWLEERGFTVCVHYRDWMPGEMIPTQIVRSVEVSRRTVILLSKDFAESLWGLLEFRTAHVRALNEGIMRVILIVLDDVVDSAGLDEDLQRYIRLNTYVRYDDPWFWDKLFYVMPRGRKQANTSPELSAARTGQDLSANKSILPQSPLPAVLNVTHQSLSHDTLHTSSPR